MAPSPARIHELPNYLTSPPASPAPAPDPMQALLAQAQEAMRAAQEMLKDYEQQNREAQNEIASNQRVMREQVEALWALNQEEDKLRQQIEEDRRALGEIAAQLAAANKKTERASERAEAAEGHAHELEHENEELRERRKTLYASIGKRTARLGEINGLINNGRATLNELANIRAQMRREILDEITALKKEKQQASGELAEILTERLAADEFLEQKLNALITTQSQLREAQKRLDTTETQNEREVARKEELDREIAQREQSLAALEKELGNKKTRGLQLDAQEEGAQARVNELREEISGLYAAREGIRSATQKERGNLNRLREQSHVAWLELINLEEEINNSRTLYVNELQKNKDELGTLAQSIQTVNEQLQQAQAEERRQREQVQAGEAELAQLRAQIQDLQQQERNREHSRAQKENDAQETIQRLQAQAAKLEEDISQRKQQAQSELEKARAEAEIVVTEALEKANRATEVLAVANKNAEEIITQAKHKNDEHTAAALTAMLEKETADAQLQHLTEQLSQLNTTLLELREKESALTGQIKTGEDKLRDLQHTTAEETLHWELARAGAKHENERLAHDVHTRRRLLEPVTEEEKPLTRREILREGKRLLQYTAGGVVIGSAAGAAGQRFLEGQAPHEIVEGLRKSKEPLRDAEHNPYLAVLNALSTPLEHPIGAVAGGAVGVLCWDWVNKSNRLKNCERVIGEMKRINEEARATLQTGTPSSLANTPMLKPSVQREEGPDL